MILLYYIKTLGKNILWQIFLLTVLATHAFCINGYNSKINKSIISSMGVKKKTIRLSEHLQCFYPLQSDAGYSVTICTDLPVNNAPGCAYKKGEPGHVFLILSKLDKVTGEITNRSFGFYPRVPVTCILKRVRSKIIDNSNREYNASIECKLTNVTFAQVVEKCIALAEKKYDLKKFNCYDYALEIFNSLPGIEKIPVTKIKFPFILGRGGSPCGLYKDLKKLTADGSAWAACIRFGIFKSPAYGYNKDLSLYTGILID